jgi:hypothetical protein
VLVPRVRQVDRAAVVRRATKDAACAVLLCLLVTVVARLAQALQIRAIVEQFLVAPMRPDVVDNRRLHQLADALVHAAPRVLAQLQRAQAPPCRPVVEVVVLGHRIQAAQEEAPVTVRRRGFEQHTWIGSRRQCQRA